jgi:hypothetical protein
MCGIGSMGCGAMAPATYTAPLGAAAAPQLALAAAPIAMASTSTATQFLGATQATGGQAQVVDLGVTKKSTWKQGTGTPSQSAKAQAAFANVSALIAKYPTSQALLAAGFQPNEGSGGTHWRVPGEKIYADGTVFVGGLVTKNGITTGAQMDSKARQLTSAIPEGWNGVQWHYHDDASAGWMFHIDATKPIDQAFQQEASLGSHH